MPRNDSSVRRWIARFQDGNRAAVQPLWETYFHRLVHLADGRLKARHRRVLDAEDVALSAFDSLCRAIEGGRYPHLTDPDDLWRLLVAITVHKALHAVRDEQRQKRGGKFRDLGALEDLAAGACPLDQIVSREPSPEFAVQVAEEVEQLLTSLGSDELVQLATWKLEGYTNEEIATRWGRAVRTVERKLKLIRKIWIANSEAE